MTMMGLTLRGAGGSSRWLLLASLALNLFFIGVGGALLMRSDTASTQSRTTSSNRTMAERIDRIAAGLPREDAAQFRTAYQARHEEIEGSLTAYRQRQEGMRTALRAEPFDVDRLKTAMAEMRAARQVFDRQVHEFFALQASAMSPAGREKLADWRNRRTGTSQSSNN
jgi:uncharacterized membrane protein